MGQAQVNPDCRSCGRASSPFFSYIDLVGPQACYDKGDSEWANCEKSCECCIDDMENTMPLSNASTSGHESLLRALAGMRESQTPSLHDAEDAHGLVAVSRSVILVDTWTTAEGQLMYSNVNAVLVIDHQLTFIKIVPHTFSQLPQIMIPIDKVELISSGEDNVSDPFCWGLDESEILKAVFIQYMTECGNSTRSVCFLLDSCTGQRAFVKALAFIWHEKQHCFPLR